MSTLNSPDIIHVMNGTRLFPELLPFRLCVILIFQTSNSHKCMGVIGKALQLHSGYKKPFFFYCKSHKNPYQYYKSHENLYQVLQVTHAVSERVMKLMICMIKSLSPQYQAIPEKIYHLFVVIGIEYKWQQTCGIPLYNGDKYISISSKKCCR